MSICHPDCPHFSNSPSVVFSGSGTEAPISVSVTREENTSVIGFLLPIPTKLSESKTLYICLHNLSTINLVVRGKQRFLHLAISEHGG